MCRYKLATYWQNFHGNILNLSENIAKSFRGATFFDSHCILDYYVSGLRLLVNLHAGLSLFHMIEFVLPFTFPFYFFQISDKHATRATEQQKRMRRTFVKN